MNLTNKQCHILRKILPMPILSRCRDLYPWLEEDMLHLLISFLVDPNNKSTFSQRLTLLRRMNVISSTIECPHTQYEMLSVIKSIFLPVKGCVVEAGAYKGGSTAKFSIASKMAGRELYVFDSFEGIPENDEPHDKNIFGNKIQVFGKAGFPTGAYCGTLDEVKRNISQLGEIEVCRFVKGWFENTMPSFSQPIIAAYLDVDLASSTKTCLRYLYPLLIPGGHLYSQDGHLPLVIDVFDDDVFWEREIGCPKPQIIGLKKKKLIKIVKPDTS